MEAMVVEFEEKKEMLRVLAKGELLEHVIPNKGKIRVTKPREGSETEVMIVNEDKLKSHPDLTAKLVEKGVIKYDIKKVAPARAAVTVEPNV